MTLAKSTQSPTTQTTSTEQFSVKIAITHIHSWAAAAKLWIDTARDQVPEALSCRGKALWDIADDAEVSDLLRLACIVFLMGWLVQLVVWLAPLLIWLSRAVALGLVAMAVGHLCRWGWSELDSRLQR